MGQLSEQEINERLKKIPGWSFSKNQIEKEYKLKDFRSALIFVNKLGEEAEKMDHHPDISIHSYNKVRITLSTHSQGGVTNKDFDLAEKIQNLS